MAEISLHNNYKRLIFLVFWSNELTKLPINTSNYSYFFLTQFLLNLVILYLSLNILKISKIFQFSEIVEENLNYSIARNFSSVEEVLIYDISSASKYNLPNVSPKFKTN